MTTIACDRKSMAADSRRTRGGFAYTSSPKVRKINGDLVGAAGDVSDIEKFSDWYKTKENKLPKLRDMNALVLTKEGVLYEVYENGVFIEVIEPFYAIGSGFELAMAAMEAGASTKKAVEIACKYDKNSGLPVQVERIK